MQAMSSDIKETMHLKTFWNTDGTLMDNCLNFRQKLSKYAPFNYQRQRWQNSSLYSVSALTSTSKPPIGKKTCMVHSVDKRFLSKWGYCQDIRNQIINLCQQANFVNIVDAD